MLITPAVLALATTLPVPFVRQHRESCGAAALAMVLAYWDHAVPHDAIAAELLDPELHGIPGSRLEAFARSRGLTAIAYEGELDQVRSHVSKGRPVIVALEVGRGRYHNVVVLGWDEARSEVLVHDPARGPRRAVPAGRFDRRWAGTERWSLLIAPAQDARPMSYDAWVARGVERARQGDGAGAREAFGHALAIDPARPEARVETGGLLFLERRYSDAADELGAALKLRDDHYTRELRGSALHLDGREGEALDEWNRIDRPRVGTVRVTGLVRTREDLLRGELAFVPDGVLTRGQLELSERRLADLGVFPRVRMRVVPERERAEVEVAVVERHGFGSPAQWLMLSAVNAVHRWVRLDYANAGGRGIALEGAWRWQDTQPWIGGSVRWPRPGGLPLSLRAAAHSERPRYDVGGPFTLSRVEWSLGAGRVVAPGTRVEAGWRLADRSVTVERPDVPPGLVTGPLVNIEQRLLRSHRHRLSASLQWFQAGKAVGSDLGFGRAVARLAYRASLSPVGGDSELAAQTVWGHASRQTPLDEQFALGVADEMAFPLRGHYMRSGGVLGAAPIARDLAMANVEWRKRVIQITPASLGIAVFADLARVNASDEPGSRGLIDLGVGLRASVLGTLLRLDYGWSVNGDGKSALSLGIGHAF